MTYRYIDSKTGKKVSEETWRRSKSQGGKRYKRQIVKKQPKKKKKKKQVPPPPPPMMVRLTISAPFMQRQGRSRKSSYKAKAVRGTAYFESQEEAEEAAQEMIEEAEERRDDWIATSGSNSWYGADVTNIEAVYVERDNNLLEIGIQWDNEGEK